MIIRCSQRSGARNLATHLNNTRDNDHVTVAEIKGLVGRNLHEALLEIDAVSKATRCEQPLFSTSFNPPEGAEVTEAQFEDAFNRFERKMGLNDQPRVVVYHEKNSRRHAHVIWSRIDVQEMKAIRMSHFKNKSMELSRELYQEHGWDMPRGMENKQEAERFNLTPAQWNQLKRHKVDPNELRGHIKDAWQVSDNVSSFSHALKERGLFLAKGDKRGFVLMDHTEKVFSLSKFGDFKRKELKAKLGDPDGLPSVAMAAVEIRSIYNSEMKSLIKELKQKQRNEMLPLEEKKALLVTIQRAQRQEQKDQHRVKRNLTSKSVREGFKKGILGLFDKVTGKERRLRLVGKDKLNKLKERHGSSRQKLVFEHNLQRAELQQEIQAKRDEQRLERKELAKRIFDIRTHNHEQKRGTLSHRFDSSSLDKSKQSELDQTNDHEESYQEKRKSERKREREENTRKKGRSFTR